MKDKYKISEIGISLGCRILYFATRKQIKNYLKNQYHIDDFILKKGYSMIEINKFNDIIFIHKLKNGEIDE
jgi:hypothetical protein